MNNDTTAVVKVLFVASLGLISVTIPLATRYSILDDKLQWD